jgi:D-alanine--poly(phosphoribitol) ligase subunit 2
MAAAPNTVERVQLLIHDALSIDVPAGDTDLVDSGLLDSLGLVTLIVEIEREFELELPLDEFELDRFRSAQNIAEFLTQAYPTAT